MNVLVINCGSSSIKYQVMDPDRNELLCKGLVELSGDTSTFAYTKTGSEKTTVNLSLADHTAGVEKIIATITDPEVGCIKDLSEIGAVGHRMVHGGEDFASSVLVSDEVIAACEANAELAPIHNPAKYRRRRSVQKGNAGSPDGSGIRYRIPSDDGSGSIFICDSL